MNRIACSPLTGRIHIGRTNAAGTVFVGEKRDVTSDVLRAIIEKAEFHSGTFDIEGGGRKWIVVVTKLPTQTEIDNGPHAMLGNIPEDYRP